MENTLARKLKQVPEGYLVVGIDPHKKKHAAVAIVQDFTTRAKYKFDNTREGLETMLRRTRTEMVKSDWGGVMCAIETGGHYWWNIAYFLKETEDTSLFSEDIGWNRGRRPIGSLRDFIPGGKV